MSKRRKLGSSYTEYPAIKVQRWTIGNVFKILATIAICLIWVGVYYVFVGIYNFLNINLLGNPEQDVMKLFRSQTSFIIMCVGIVLITLYVFTSSKMRQKR